MITPAHLPQHPAACLANGRLSVQRTAQQQMRFIVRSTASKGRDRLRFFLLFALTACDVGRLPWSCSTSNPPAGLADEKKLWTPDLFDSYLYRSYKQKSSGRQLPI